MCSIVVSSRCRKENLSSISCELCKNIMCHVNGFTILTSNIQKDFCNFFLIHHLELLYSLKRISLSRIFFSLYFVMNINIFLFSSNFLLSFMIFTIYSIFKQRFHTRMSKCKFFTADVFLYYLDFSFFFSFLFNQNKMISTFVVACTKSVVRGSRRVFVSLR